MSQPIRSLAIGRPLLSPVKNNTGLYSDLGTPDEFLVAEVQGGKNPDSEMGMYVRLFTAAPEMYELIGDLSQAYDDSQSGRELASRLYDLRCVALRLLAKVEGGGDE